MNHLARDITFHLTFDAPEVAGALGARMTTGVRAWIKVDTGYGRTGVRWNDRDRLKAVAGQILQGTQCK